jgi:hypothetical protein
MWLGIATLTHLAAGPRPLNNPTPRYTVSTGSASGEAESKEAAAEGAEGT